MEYVPVDYKVFGVVCVLQYSVGGLDIFGSLYFNIL